MQCIVPACGNTSTIETGGITFHEFPSEERLRAAWLKALGRQDARLPDSAVVCSRHFLNEDVYVSESGVRQICAGAVPSTVMVCMACLDTDSELLLLSKHKLHEAYEQLTGHPPCDLGYLQQTLCVQCAQTVRDFSRFREQSLRARSLMMHLLETHGLITMRHLEVIKHELRNEFVTSPLEADDSDSHMEHVNENNQTAPEEGDCSVIKREFKTEEESLSIEEVMDVCVPQVALPSRLATDDEYEARATEEADTTQRRERARATDSGALHNRPSDSDDDTRTDIRHCVVVLYDIFKHPNINSLRNEAQKRRDINSCDSLNTATACKDAQYRAASESEVAAAHDEPAASALSDTEPSASGNTSHLQSQKKSFICVVCQHAFTRKSALINHIKIHNKLYARKISNYKSEQNNQSFKRTRTHIGEKSFACDLCLYKSRSKFNLGRHMKTHTGEKPFVCKLCEYKCGTKRNLVIHMKTHTGERPFACKFCSYKSGYKHHLMTHMATHTGEKPFACELCEYKSGSKFNLVRHMKIHTGEKPFACKLCEYKCTTKYNLAYHMKTHTGEKPFACKLCCYKCVQKSHLVSHLKTHW